jgi:hypothetical protein
MIIFSNTDLHFCFRRFVLLHIAHDSEKEADGALNELVLRHCEAFAGVSESSKGQSTLSAVFVIEDIKCK